MKKYLLLILCILCTGSVAAQKIKGKYISRFTDEGSITYIYPQEGYNSKELSSNLKYDITYSSSTDSVTFNFTYISKEPLPLDSAKFSNNDIHYSIPATMFYIEPGKGDKWENRASIIISDDEFKDIRTQSSPCSLTIYARKKESSSIKSYKFGISDKNWKKNTNIINKIFDVIKYNN